MKMVVNGESELRALGARIASHCGGGEVFELVGDVGAGKTTFTKGLGAGLGITEPIQSPTFTISRVYDTPTNLVLAHYDFYRLHDAGVMAAELHETLHDPQTITVIEWAEVIAGVLPEDRLRITITSPTIDSREVDITSGGPRSQAVLEAVL